MPIHRHTARPGLCAPGALGVVMLALLTAWTRMPVAAAPMSPAERGFYLFAYFTGNGEDGLHMASSRDGLTWAALNGGRPFLTPKVGSKLMRDPCVVRGPDGVFHMVWTTGWSDRGIGVAHSKDLLEWSEQQAVPVMGHEPTAINAWAPEIVYDAAKTHYLIYWSTTIPGRFPDTDATGNERTEGGRLNHRIYAATTRDFRTYAPATLFYDGGFNVIDATIVADGRRFVMIVKDETQHPVARKHLRTATAERIDGPYGPASAAFTPDWVEGPSLLRVGDAWLLYFDEYTRHRYGVLRSHDLSTWEQVPGGVRFPEGVRHGTAFAVTQDIFDRLALPAAK